MSGNNCAAVLSARITVDAAWPWNILFRGIASRCRYLMLPRATSLTKADLIQNGSGLPWLRIRSTENNP